MVKSPLVFTDLPSTQVIWFRWASDDLSAFALQFIAARALNLDDAAVLATSIASRSFQYGEDFLQYLSRLLSVAGRDEAGIDKISTLIVGNTYITDTDRLHKCLKLIGSRPTFLSRVNYYDIKFNLRFTFLASAILHGVMPEGEALKTQIFNYLMNNKRPSIMDDGFRDVDDALDMFVVSNSTLRREASFKTFLSTDIDREYIISSNMMRWKVNCTSTRQLQRIFQVVCGARFLERLEALSVFGVYIKSLPDYTKLSFVETLLARSLGNIFDSVDMPMNERPVFVRMMALKLLGLDDVSVTPKPVREAAPSAVDPVAGGDPMKDMPVPSVAPALWKQDRAEVDGKLENPVEFTQRHYGQWLGNGLTTAHILRLDPDLYARLEDFLSPRSNKRGKKTVPEGFVLPKRAEAPEAWISRVRPTPKLFDQEIEPTLETAKELERMAKAIRRDLAKANAK